MIEMYKTDMETGKLILVNEIEKGVWINLVNPSKEEIQRLHREININEIFATYLLDYEERARIDVEDDQKLIVIDVPIVEEDNTTHQYTTTPLSILIIKDEIILTSSALPLDLIDIFKQNKVKGFYTYKKTRFVLQLLYSNAIQFLKYVKNITKDIDSIEINLQKHLENKEILKMLSISKSLVYFSTSLKSNEAVMERLLRGRILRLYEEDEDILEDTIIENKQAIEMTKIHTDILNSATETYSSLISNNLNVVMKFLASVTIVLSLPTIIASLFGMNVILPFSSEDPMAFVYILLLSFLISGITFIWLKIKNLL